MSSTENDTSSMWRHWLNWAYDGVDYSLPGNGGTDCVNFIGVKQRIAESGLASLLAGYIMYRSYWRVDLPKKVKTLSDGVTGVKQVLLVVFCLVFGIELGFKLATRQMIWILNPCHVVTMMQIYLLAAPPSRIVMVVFRLHMHMLAGACIALIFPVINTRLLPFEQGVYWVQHIMIMVIPVYLMTFKGVYSPEPLRDLNWSGSAFGLLFLYHFIPLQILAYFSCVNLNNMLCPAVSDPFYGQWYRLWAMSHQVILIPSFGKLYTWVSQSILRGIYAVQCTKGENSANKLSVSKGDYSGDANTNCDNFHQCDLGSSTDDEVNRIYTKGDNSTHSNHVNNGNNIAVNTNNYICNGHLKNRKTNHVQ